MGRWRVWQLQGTGTANAIVGGSSGISILTVNESGIDSFAGGLGGSGTDQNNLALVQAGSGTLTLSAANTYTGGTTISAGTLVVGNSATLGGGDVNLNGGFSFG